MMRYTISLSLASLLATSTAALAEVPRVVTDIPPVQALVALVMGDLGMPELLLDNGGNAHSFQLRPSQAQALAAADLVVWIGPEMTPWLERALTATASAATHRALIDAEGTYRQAFGATSAHDHAGETAETHDDGEAPAATEAHDETETPETLETKTPETETQDAHDHSGTDPHAWLDPANASLWLGVIAADLARLDPDHRAEYAANAKAGQAQIAALDAEVAALLAPVKHKPFVVFHDAYGYFSAHYGLRVAGTVALGDAVAPGAARLAELQATLAAGSGLCIFPEANHDPKLIAQIAEGSAAILGGALDPEGAGIAPGAALYGDLLRGLAVTLADCLGKS